MNPDAGVARLGAWRGVAAVARLELRQRLRSSRWTAALVLWVSLLAFVTATSRLAVSTVLGVAAPVQSGGVSTGEAVEALARRQASAVLFAVVVLLVLVLGALVAPALTATSVNGDRASGVLAALQVTLLTPAQIAAGKLLVAWGTALTLLVTALPFVLWTTPDGGVPASALLPAVGVLALTLLVVCALGLGWSAVAARAATSVAATYVSVAVLLAGMPAAFAVTLPLVTRTGPAVVARPVAGLCQEVTVGEQRRDTAGTWWLLASSPVVVLADVAPRPVLAGGTDPLAVVRDAVRRARLGPERAVPTCVPGQLVGAGAGGRAGQGAGQGAGHGAGRRAVADRDRAGAALGPVWPVGLGVDLAVGALAFLVAVRRLRTPVRRVRPGARVA